jgi:5-methylcytosine-specific restriction endonuclease McrA
MQIIELVKWITSLIQNNNIKAFYNSALWEHKRAEALERDNNECQKCKGRGKYKRADCVHHEKHVKDRPDLALDLDNLTSLCNSCHDEEHPEKLYRSRNKSNKKFINEERW